MKISESGNQIVTRAGPFRFVGDARAKLAAKVDRDCLSADRARLRRAGRRFRNRAEVSRPVTLNFLFSVYSRSPADAEAGEAALEMALLTLRKMAAGGCTINWAEVSIAIRSMALWRIPHFEKCSTTRPNWRAPISMLIRSPAICVTKPIARDTLDYVRRDLTDAGGRILFRRRCR